MADSVQKVLFVNSEMCPYLPESPIASLCRQLPQGIQERRKEIRAFMPKYGCINERKNQLHEVIRLSGMNIIISDVDRPLVIKVASISSARIQVYFIDNEDYFRRKQIYRDADGQFFADNGERAIFYARGVLETVKKLRWAPDIIHCHGWISHVLPLYLKKAYKDDLCGGVCEDHPFRRHQAQGRSPSGECRWHGTCSACRAVFRRHHPGIRRCGRTADRRLPGTRETGSPLRRGSPGGRKLH